MTVQAAHICQGPRAASTLTAEQDLLLVRLDVLQDKRDWHHLALLEREGEALARDVRGKDPSTAARIHSILGNGLHGIGEYERAILRHEVSARRLRTPQSSLQKILSPLTLCH